MAHRLAPDQLFPAGVDGIVARHIDLSTGVRLRIAESGPRDGTPVIMLHGWGASMYMFRHALAMLPEYGVRAIAVDLRGYGLSDRPRTRGSYTLAAYIADLDALFDALSLRRATIMGQSMGGGIALRFAQRRADRVSRLVLVNPTGLVPVPWVNLVRIAPPFIASWLDGGLAPRWLIGFILRRIAYGDAKRVTQRDIDEYWAPTQIRGFVHAVRASIGEFNWKPLSRAEAEEIETPTVVILGTKDRLVRHARPVAERLRRSQVFDVVGGHCVHEEHPDGVYRLVGNFVREGAALEMPPASGQPPRSIF